MIIQSLQLENFRQFYGVQTLGFATSDRQNVTLVHGFNGAGKTALLNAFTWCLFGQTSDDFDAPDAIENETAFLELSPGASMTVRVRMHFKSRSDTYIVERTQKITRQPNNMPLRSGPELELLMQKLQETGPTHVNPSARQQIINRILPPNLWKFFFFNGERMEWLAKPAAYEDVETGLKSLLDIEVLERSVNHLRGGVAKQLSNDLKGFADADLNEAIDKLEKLKTTADQYTARELELGKNIAALNTEKQTLMQRQAELQVTRELAIRRHGLEEVQDGLLGQLKERTKEVAAIVSRDGFLAFAADDLAATEQLVTAARERGELPAKIKPQFVQDLLDQNLCICGRPLGPDHPDEVHKLEAWRKDVGLAEYEEAISQTSSDVVALKNRRELYFSRLDDLQAKRAEIQKQLRMNNEELSEVKSKLGDPAHGDEAASLAHRIAQLDNDIAFALADEMKLRDDISENAEAQESVEKQIHALKIKDAKGELIRRQRETVQKLADVLQNIFEIQREDVRKDLNTRIARIWGDAAVKDYEASLTPQFRLSLTKRVGGVLQEVQGASTGEKQVLALSFIGSLVDKARDKITSGGIQGASGLPSGGLYPLIMDSPFGSLEDDYRAKVAEWIPKLSPQVIIMVSNSQWRQEVENAVRPRVGREYILELHTAKKEMRKSIWINGDEFPYVVLSPDGSEKTVLQEVK